jgi:hypothetical protein
VLSVVLSSASHLSIAQAEDGFGTSFAWEVPVDCVSIVCEASSFSVSSVEWICDASFFSVSSIKWISCRVPCVARDALNVSFVDWVSTVSFKFTCPFEASLVPAAP